MRLRRTKDGFGFDSGRPTYRVCNDSCKAQCRQVEKDIKISPIHCISSGGECHYRKCTSDTSFKIGRYPPQNETRAYR